MHGAALVVLDGLGLGAGLSDRATSAARDASFAFLLKQAPADMRGQLITITSQHRGKRATAAAAAAAAATASDVSSASTAASASAVVQLDQEQSTLKFGMFSVALGPHAGGAGGKQGQQLASKYALHAPTPSNNLMRVMRSLQLNKPILLEGSPGVGKSSLIATLAAMTGHRLLRINLSEQTGTIADLLGADLPVVLLKKNPGRCRRCGCKRCQGGGRRGGTPVPMVRRSLFTGSPCRRLGASRRTQPGTTERAGRPQRVP